MRAQIYRTAVSILFFTTLIVTVGLACAGGDDPTREPRTRSTTPPEVTATPESTPTATPDPTPTATPEPTDTSTPMPMPPPTATPTPEPLPTAVPEEEYLVISMIMSEFGLTPEDLSKAESSCMQEWVGGIDPDVFEGDNPPPEVVAGMLGCIPDVFISVMVGEMGLSLDDLSREERACLRILLDEPDLFIAMSAPEDSPEFAEATGRMVSCLPDTFISLMVGEMGLSLDDLSREERACLRVLFDEPDLFIAMSAPEDSPEFAEATGRMVSCLPDTFISLMVGEMGLSLDDLSREERACLRVLFDEPDLFIAMSASEDSPEFAEATARMMSCLPDVLISLFVVDFGLTMDDLSTEEVSCAREKAAGINWVAALAADESTSFAAYDEFEKGLISCVSGLSGGSQ